MSGAATFLRKASSPWGYFGRGLGGRKWIAIFFAAAFLSAGSLLLWADQIEMQNGDRYVGTVLSLNANTLVLHSEVLGDLTLPRAKVALITLRPIAITNLVSTLPASTNSRPRALSVTRTNAAEEELPAGFRLLAANSNLVEKVTAPFLDGAGPEAKAKFQELFGGLVSGSLTVEDIRVQARSAVEQLKELKRDGGDDTGLLDGYLTILEKFLGEPSPSGGSATNAPTSRAKP